MSFLLLILGPWLFAHADDFSDSISKMAEETAQSVEAQTNDIQKNVQDQIDKAEAEAKKSGSVTEKTEPGNQLCDLLSQKANQDQVATSTNQDLDAKLKDLQAVFEFTAKYQDLIKQGVSQKMSWSEFKSWVNKQKGLSLAPIFESAYAKEYLSAYCGQGTEATTKIINGNSERITKKTTYEKNPAPADHSYTKELSGAR